MGDKLTEATEWERREAGRYRHALDDVWANGPGAYGGVVAAAALHQMRRTLDDPEQRPRTLELAMCAPVHFEETTLEVEVDRRGRSVSFVSAVFRQGNDTCATASATFGASSEDAPAFDTPGAEMPEPQEVDPYPAVELMPKFAQEFFEFRHCVGSLPMAGAETPETGGWLRMDEPAVADLRLAACMLDAWPPSPMTVFETFRPMVTVQLTYHFFQDFEAEEEADDLFFRFESHSEAAHGGFAEEDATLRTRSGELIASARQLYKILD